MDNSQRDAESLEEKLIEQYRSLTSTSRSLYERACRVLPSGVTRRTVYFPPYPNYIVKGEGCRVYDVDGREYIDYANNYGPLILGHNAPAVTQRIKNQLDCGTVLGGPTELEIELAEKILHQLPTGDQVFFSASGTEAGMICLRALRAHTKKEKILTCEGSYHGSSDAFIHGAGVPEYVKQNTVTVPFNDIEAFENAVKEHKHELAAVFMEPIMRGIPPKPGYLAQVRNITEDNELFLVFDEVVTGFRLSRGGAQEKWGVKPDMTMLGKLIGGGMPIGAVVGSKELFKAYKSAVPSGIHFDQPTILQGGTYNGHPVAMAGGLATLNELTPTAYTHLDHIGEKIMHGMREILERIGVRAQVVGVGSVFHLHFTDRPVVDARSANTANTYLQRYYDLSMLVHGIFMAKAHCNFVSTPITETEVDTTLGVFDTVIDSMKPVIKKAAPHLL